MNKILILVLCAGAVSSNVSSNFLISKKGPANSVSSSGFESTLGIVSPVFRCGGVGTPLQLRISGCDGRCSFTPGTRYEAEKDFIPSSASQSLTLVVSVCSQGICMTILNTELADSSVQPGFIYTAKYSIVPNDIFSGNTIEFKAYISSTNLGFLEVCIGADIDIL